MTYSPYRSPAAGGGRHGDRHHLSWTLRYDEMDYVLSGRLDIRIGGETVSAAGPGADLYPKEQLHLIPVLRHGHARFLYFVYPADWQSQGG